MKMRFAIGILGVLLGSSALQAAPITYAFTGQLSGSLAGTTFALANVSLTLASDTDTVFRPQPTVRPTLFNSGPGILRFSINGASGAFNPLFNAFSVTLSNGSSLVGVTERGSNDLIDVVGPALRNYDLRSAIGPVTNAPIDFLNFDTPFQTSLGELIFFDDDDAFVAFSAVTGAVPEPGTWAMMIGGFGLAGASLRGRRRVAVSFA